MIANLLFVSLQNAVCRLKVFSYVLIQNSLSNLPLDDISYDLD